MRAQHWRQRLGDAALALLYPEACRVCGSALEAWADGVACAGCWRQAGQEWQARELCLKCGAPLRALMTAASTAPGRECGKCREFAFTRARAGGAYTGAVLENVLWLKRHPQLVPQLRALLCRAFDQQPEFRQCHSIIPVPLHVTRQRERQFNQAELIANALAAHCGLRVNNASLVRVKATERHRLGMDVTARAKSLRKAFRVRAPRLLLGRSVLVVDDVMTTGATAHELAQTLLASGAQAVYVLTLARAIARYI